MEITLTRVRVTTEAKALEASKIVALLVNSIPFVTNAEVESSRKEEEEVMESPNISRTQELLMKLIKTFRTKFMPVAVAIRRTNRILSSSNSEKHLSSIIKYVKKQYKV